MVTGSVGGLTQVICQRLAWIPTWEASGPGWVFGYIRIKSIDIYLMGTIGSKHLYPQVTLLRINKGTSKCSGMDLEEPLARVGLLQQ